MGYKANKILTYTDKKQILVRNNVLKNTYILLGFSLLFSAASAWFAMVNGAQSLGIFEFIIGAYGLMFLTNYLRNSSWGLVAVFAFTGFMGYSLAPVINGVIDNFNNGSEIITLSLSLTGLIFLTLSAHVLSSKKDYSYLQGFILTGTIVIICAILASIFIKTPALHLAISACVILISCGWILFTTSRIINGGETNYIIATVCLYVDIYNLFISILRLFTFFAGNRD